MKSHNSSTLQAMESDDLRMIEFAENEGLAIIRSMMEFRTPKEGIGVSPKAEQNIYSVLAAHQRSEPWAPQELMIELQTWAERFNVEFKLDVPEVTLCIDRLPNNRYGHFRDGHNGFGLKGEIAINSLYLKNARAWWEILGTLLHELLHAWQQAHGSPSNHNHHNSEFRDKAKELGLIVDRKGVTSYSAESAFKTLLHRENVEVATTPITPVIERPTSRSKLRKYTCECTTVRVAKTDFKAKCLLCDKDFVIAASRR